MFPGARRREERRTPAPVLMRIWHSVGSEMTQTEETGDNLAIAICEMWSWEKVTAELRHQHDKRMYDLLPGQRARQGEYRIMTKMVNANERQGEGKRK